MKIENSKILVTGGAGFIGSHIVESLVMRGAKVRVLDNLSSGSLENLASVIKDIEFIQGDIRDKETLAKATKGIEIVSHQAAQLEITLSFEEPLLDLEINTIATLNLLDICLRNNVKKFIFASSACVYGQKETITKENSQRRPNWAYGISKLAAEEYCRLYSEVNPLSVTVLRYSIIFGEREWYRRAIPIFLKRVIQKLPPVVFGGGEAIRDFLYVGDLVNLHNLLIERDDIKFDIFNVSSGIPRKIIDVAKLISEKFFDGSIIYENLKEGESSNIISGKQRNKNDLRLMWLDPSKAKETLGWNIATSFEDALEKEYNWALKNLHRWSEILKIR
jgi:nucleoside-diphosphate-sugar epimerase